MLGAAGKIRLSGSTEGYYFITQGISGGIVGYNDGGIGSISLPDTWAGVRVLQVLYDTGANTIQVLIDGNRAKSFFTSITPQDSAALSSSASTHSYNGGSDWTSWLWTSVTVPAVWDGSGVVTASIV